MAGPPRMAARFLGQTDEKECIFEAASAHWADPKSQYCAQRVCSGTRGEGRRPFVAMGIFERIGGMPMSMPAPSVVSVVFTMVLVPLLLGIGGRAVASSSAERGRSTSALWLRCYWFFASCQYCCSKPGDPLFGWQRNPAESDGIHRSRSHAGYWLRRTGAREPSGPLDRDGVPSSWACGGHSTGQLSPAKNGRVGCFLVSCERSTCPAARWTHVASRSRLVRSQ